jgi:hypothetical protein
MGTMKFLAHYITSFFFLTRFKIFIWYSPSTKKPSYQNPSFGSPAIFRDKDPLLSAPFSRRVWLYRDYFY